MYAVLSDVTLPEYIEEGEEEEEEEVSLEEGGGVAEGGGPAGEEAGKNAGLKSVIHTLLLSSFSTF